MATKVDVTTGFIRPHNDNPGILEQLSTRFAHKTTPDFLERKLDEYIPVFVYGTLRRGFPNHHLLKDMPYLGSAHTTLEKYEMRQTGGGAFPVVFERELKIKGKKRNPVVGKIRGEVFVVDPLTLLALDRLENNGGMYNRQLQWVFLAEQSQKPNAKFRPSIKAWMYMGNEFFWQGRGAEERVESGVTNGIRYYDWADEVAESKGSEASYGYLHQ